MNPVLLIFLILVVLFVLASWIFAISVFRKIKPGGTIVLLLNLFFLVIYSLLFGTELRDSSGWDIFAMMLLWMFVSGGHSLLLFIASFIVKRVRKTNP